VTERPARAISVCVEELRCVSLSRLSSRSMILVDGQSTDGHLGLIRDVVPAGHAGPRLHLHPAFDEGFYVLAGELVFRVGDRVWVVKAGGVALARRGQSHTFANQTDTDVPILMFVTPAGFEQYFAAGATQARPPDEFTIIVGGHLKREAGTSCG
jgi:quercetin dioxygenase-like cupin family protein